MDVLNTQEALTWIEAATDPRELVAMSEALRLKRADVVAFDPADGVLIRLRTAADYLLAARDEAAAVRLMADVLVAGFEGEQVALPDASWAAALGLDPERTLGYRICIRESTEPLPFAGSLRIEPLAVDDLPVVARIYRNLPEETVARHLADGWVYGGYNDAGELVGFVGEHDEGAIGMLEVLPEHRRRGYASELEGFMVNRMLAAGRVPYCQVVADNEASFSLQRKLGFTVLSAVQCWYW